MAVRDIPKKVTLTDDDKFVRT